MSTEATPITEHHPCRCFFSALGRDIFLEFNGCTRGRRWLDSLREGQDLTVWLGRLRVEVSPRSR